MTINLNKKTITKLLLEFEDIESEILALLEIDYSSTTDEVHTTWVENVTMQIKSRITTITNQFIQAYKANEGCEYKVVLNGEENSFSGELLVLTLFNNLLFKLFLKIINLKTVNISTKMLLLNRLVYDNESVAKKLDTISSILYLKDNNNE